MSYFFHIFEQEMTEKKRTVDELTTKCRGLQDQLGQRDSLIKVRETFCFIVLTAISDTYSFCTVLSGFVFPLLNGSFVHMQHNCASRPSIQWHYLCHVLKHLQTMAKEDFDSTQYVIKSLTCLTHIS